MNASLVLYVDAQTDAMTLGGFMAEVRVCLDLCLYVHVCVYECMRASMRACVYVCVRDGYDIVCLRMYVCLYQTSCS